MEDYIFNSVAETTIPSEIADIKVELFSDSSIILTQDFLTKSYISFDGIDDLIKALIDLRSTLKDTMP